MFTGLYQSSYLYGYNTTTSTTTTTVHIWLQEATLFIHLDTCNHGCYSRKLHTAFRELYGHHTDLAHRFDKCYSHNVKGFVYRIWHVTGLPNRDVCHMWCRKLCSLFPEHLISLPLWSFFFMINYGLMTLVCLPGLVRLLYLGLIWLIWCVPTVNTEYYYYTCTVFRRINARLFA